MEIKNEDKEVENYGYEVRKKYNLKYLLVTRSEKGMSLIAEDKVYHTRSEAKEVYDVSGAGDTVVATLATAISTEMNILDAAKIANTTAGIVVGKVGTAPITLDELRNALDGYRNKKLKNLQDLLSELAMLRAKELGDILVVGLESDNSVKKKKGKGRPINKQEDRAELLVCLEFVDYVVIFDGDAFYSLIGNIKPDVLVKRNTKTVL